MVPLHAQTAPTIPASSRSCARSCTRPAPDFDTAEVLRATLARLHHHRRHDSTNLRVALADIARRHRHRDRQRRHRRHRYAHAHRAAAVRRPGDRARRPRTTSRQARSRIMTRRPPRTSPDGVDRRGDRRGQRQRRPTRRVTSPDLSPISGRWRRGLAPASSTDITVFAAGEVARVEGPTFTPGDAETGLALRVRAVYKDANGVLEEVFSAPTAPVENVNDPATGAPTISDTTPTQDRLLTASTDLIADPDGTDDCGGCLPSSGSRPPPRLGRSRNYRSDGADVHATRRPGPRRPARAGNLHRRRRHDRDLGLGPNRRGRHSPDSETPAPIR